ncbi:phosphotransferase family protein [Actinomadura rubrisoli]|uniref:Aminoglycoside phosphotransferase family protein n=1 Tax=Actinomadura rubrisoli TaxID=2530368 RepID=A0A4V2YYL8_9ACTN|nr:aminoglycoside phosphotransferase family protein [Actinomadura rubrisoli]TDD93647.1 aminoglycoside phosphotransferase family protein [Actinomadura rubrisoli]
MDVLPIEEGGDHHAWWVGAGHVLRMARDQDGSVRQLREIALRDALRPFLAVPVPESVATGEWAPGLTYSVDGRLLGVSAEERAVSPGGEADLAGLLTGLRSFPVAKAAALGVPASPPRDLGVLRVSAAEAAGRLDDGRAPPADPPAATTATADVPVSLVHNDLKGEHLLVGGSGRVTGVLDWTDAVLGDPAEDIAGLAISIGARAAVRVAALAGYGPGLCARALRLCRCDTVILLAARLHGEDDSPLPLLRAQRDRAWEPTPLDAP